MLSKRPQRSFTNCVMSCLMVAMCPLAATLGRFKPDRRHVVNKLNTIVIKQVSLIRASLKVIAFIKCANSLPDRGRRHSSVSQAPADTSVDVDGGARPPSRSSVCSGREDRAGQRCEHYFTALFITARLRSVTTSSPVEWNTGCHADAIMGWIQSLSKTCAEPTCTSSPTNTYLSNTEHSLFFKIMNNVLTLDGLLRTSFSFFFLKRVECSVKLV